MAIYTCEKCKKEFTDKSNYNKHLKRKNTCVNIFNECEYCNNIYSSKGNLLRHMRTCAVKNNNIIDNLKNNEEIIETLIQENKEMKKELELIKEKMSNNNIATINNSNNNINSNNITNNNNINIVNFGRERIEKLTQEEIDQILNAGSSALTQHVKMIHLNDRLPEYQNIYLSNLRGNTCLIYFNKQWMATDINDKIDDLITYGTEDIRDLLEKNDDNEKKYSRSQTKKLIDNLDDQNTQMIKDQKKKIKLALYNGKDKVKDKIKDKVKNKVTKLDSNN